MPVKRHVEIVEVGPRDGLQSEPGVLPTATKVEFILRSIAAGLRRVEVTSFVNPKKVPQMADAEEVLKALPRPGDGVYYVGLVLNRRGFERAAAAGCNEIGMAVGASDTFNRRNQGASTDESIAAWLEIAAAARAVGIRPQVTVSAAFGCPFEGEVPVMRVVEIARRVAEAGPHEIALADTIGVGAPAQVTEIVGRVREAVPGVSLRCHFHNTRNTGLANAYAAVQAGVATLDASLGGIGGCPFAPGATGNIPTEDLLYMLQRSGYETGVSLDAAIATSRWLQEQLGRAVPGMLVKAGGFPRPAAPPA
jgi:hydroxymethylglutaryl-CoA lyase